MHGLFLGGLCRQDTTFKAQQQQSTQMFDGITGNTSTTGAALISEFHKHVQRIGEEMVSMCWQHHEQPACYGMYESVKYEWSLVTLASERCHSRMGRA